MIIYKDVEVEIDLADFTTEDLVKELEDRDVLSSRDRSNELLTEIWLKRRVGRTDYQTELDQLIYHSLGRVI